MSDQGSFSDAGEQYDAGGETYGAPYDAYSEPYADDHLAAADARVEALGQQVAGMALENEAAALTADYPELGEEAAAYELVSDARRLAEHLGDETLADNPQFWRAVHEAKLQLGGGQSGAPRDLGDVIVSGDFEGGGLGRRVLPFAWESHAWEDRVHPHNPF